MMTVNEVSKLTGVSIRTLQYYDKIGLLHPAEYTEAGYRLYDDAALETLQQILLFRELEFPLKDIKKIVGSPDFDRSKALEQQIELLTLKKEHLENLIDLAKGLKLRGVRHLKFDAFDTRKIDEYAAQAKAAWGTTPAYKEFEQKSKGRTREEDQNIAQGLMDIFAEFGAIKVAEAGAKKAVILPVSAPFHSTLMKPAAEKLARELDKIELSDAAFPVVANVNGKAEQKADEIKAHLVEQADHPVLWIDCVNAMAEFGADVYVEAGPGKTLCGFNKRIDRSLVSMNVENMESLQKTLDYFKEVR